MLVKELYNLWVIEIKKGNRILAYKNYPTGIVATYTYKGTFKFYKDVSATRYFNFCDRYRGKKQQGYNRPIIKFDEYNSK